MKSGACNALLVLPFALVASFFASPAATTARSLGAAALQRDVLRVFEARYRHAQTMKATFLERYSEGGRVERVESGTAYFRRPGKMRWEYEAPEKNLFLVDGKTAWFYVPSDHTVTRIPARQSEDWRTPLALLAGEMKVSRICAQVNLDDSVVPENSGDVVLRCTLKQTGKRQERDAEDALTGGSQPDLVQFEVVRATGELRRILIHQRGGVQVEFQFRNWEFNPPVEESLFHFVPPKGVAIVNGDPR
jgi:outer membrane lipoprotein carrier protein